MVYSLPRPPKSRQQPSSNPDTPPLAPVSVSWRVIGVLTPRYRGRGFWGNDRQPSSGACVTRGRAPAAQRRCRKKRIRESKTPNRGKTESPKAPVTPHRPVSIVVSTAPHSRSRAPPGPRPGKRSKAPQSEYQSGPFALQRGFLLTAQRTSIQTDTPAR